MGEANEKRNRSREMRNLSLQIEKYPRDLLQRFMSNTTRGTQPQSREEDTPTTHSDEEIELNLGLSLGGRFGVDKNDKKKLLRSSSIAGSIPIFREIGITTPQTTTTTNTPAVMYPPLIRTSSLPTETEEEWRKRKELQTLRRMEAKRRRSEKQRNSISSSNASNSNLKMELSFEEEKQISVANSGGGGVGPPFGMQSWAAAARQVILGGGVGGVLLQGLVVQPCSQGSVESQGGTSSGMSELESKPLQGSSGVGEAKSPVNNRGSQDRNSQEVAGSSGTNAN
ncbi:hypothetical protein Dsin_009878 [Dipteronia sinensis]|uniref:Ninja-family protein n=1 Tax=Dipteronia sinensis TaxID=43782 RepID=A0AAE0ARF6_9ROSI|nr:hypothetical protein Dsin_009878 [Dipteronia sinensis]